MITLTMLATIGAGAVAGLLHNRLKPKKGTDMHTKSYPAFGRRVTALGSGAKERAERLILAAVALGAFAGAFAVVAGLARLVGHQ